MKMSQDEARVRFTKAHKPPYICVLCNSAILPNPHARKDPFRSTLAIFHIDFDHTNNTLQNHAPSHIKCHSNWHIRYPDTPKEAKHRNAKQRRTNKALQNIRTH
jgi:hypothetical protein